jgi:hypothetical protein
MSFFSIPSKWLSRRHFAEQNSAVRIFDRGRTYLPVIGTLYLCAILSYFLVWVVDPYNLRPGGVAVRLADHPYIDRVVPLVYSAAAQDGTELVLVGGSTSMGYTYAMLREAFPEAKNPVNLSFFGPRAKDFEMVLARLEQSTSLKRVILNLDWTFFKDVRGSGQPRDPHHYTQEWYDPAPDFSPEAVRLSIQVLLTGVLDLPAWKRISSTIPDAWLNLKPVASMPLAMDKVVKASETTRDWVTQGANLPCDEFPHLEGMLMPFVKKMAARGVKVDLILPPYSLAIYSDWSVNYPFNKIFPQKGGPFANFVSMRRCTVEAASGIENVYVHAFDTDFAITGNLALYLDTGHILDQKTSHDILGHVAKGDSILTTAKWTQYEAALTNAVLQFKPGAP